MLGHQTLKGNKGERFLAEKLVVFLIFFSLGVFPPTSFGWNSCRVEVDFLGQETNQKTIC